MSTANRDRARRAPDTNNSSFRGKGWKVLGENGPTPVAAAWRAGGDEVGRVDEQLIAGRRWAKELGVPGLAPAASSEPRQGRFWREQTFSTATIIPFATVTGGE